LSHLRKSGPPREGNDSQLSSRSSGAADENICVCPIHHKIFAPIDMATAIHRCFSIGQPNVSEIGGKITHQDEARRIAVNIIRLLKG